MIENIALALDRIGITEEKAKVREMVERERERANLLRAISHDLRNHGNLRNPYGPDRKG